MSVLDGQYGPRTRTHIHTHSHTGTHTHTDAHFSLLASLGIKNYNSQKTKKVYVCVKCMQCNLCF